MAFNWQTFKTRATTAVVFVVVMMAGLLWNEWSYFLLFSIVHFGGWNEYKKLVKKFNPAYEKVSLLHQYVVMIAGWCLMLFFTNDELKIAGLSLTEAGFWLGILLMILLPLVMWVEGKLVFFSNILYSIFGVLYISLPLALLVELRTHDWTSTGQADLGLVIPLTIIFSLWINDTMAYIVGSLIGKTPLSKISPKKTWEGTTGGVVLTIVVIAVLAYFTQKLSMTQAAIIAAIAAVSGTFGDLFESKLKRMAGVKDSGSIMPGHGGFLDRFDSLLFAAVFVWFFVRLAIG